MPAIAGTANAHGDPVTIPIIVPAMTAQLTSTTIESTLAVLDTRARYILRLNRCDYPTNQTVTITATTMGTTTQRMSHALKFRPPSSENPSIGILKAIGGRNEPTSRPTIGTTHLMTSAYGRS